MIVTHTPSRGEDEADNTVGDEEQERHKLKVEIEEWRELYDLIPRQL